MPTRNDRPKTPSRLWKQAAFGGVVVAIVYSMLSGAGITASVVMGLVFFVVAGVTMVITDRRRLTSTDQRATSISDTEIEAPPAAGDADQAPQKPASDQN